MDSNHVFPCAVGKQKEKKKKETNKMPASVTTANASIVSTSINLRVFTFLLFVGFALL